MLTLISDTAQLTQKRAEEKKSVGFVPTMGNLHQGHLSLLEKALQDFDVVYFSIFVNPKQFGPNEDFNRYPRTLKDDLSLIENTMKKHLDKNVVVFSPSDPQEVFPAGYDQTVIVSDFDNIIEGEKRPGHFQGVATVVFRLFELIKPSKAYFGLKDFQQYLVIKQMAKDLMLPVQIIGMPIIREPSGLALSSRNQYLSPEQKDHSLVLYKSLNQIEQILDGKKDNLPKAQAFIQELKKDVNWNYLELRDAESLSSDLKHSTRVTLLAVYQLGTTRLLDNLQMELL